MRGRVTDVLRNLPHEAGHYGAAFYVCGAGEVVQSVASLLKNVLRIPQNNIVAEAFSRPKGEFCEKPKKANCKITGHRFGDCTNATFTESKRV